MRLGEFRRVQFSGILGEYFQGVSISQPLFSCFLAFYEYIFSFYASVFKLIAEGRRAPCDSFHGVTSLPWVVAHTVPNLLTDVSVLGLSCFCVFGGLSLAPHPPHLLSNRASFIYPPVPRRAAVHYQHTQHLSSLCIPLKPESTGNLQGQLVHLYISCYTVTY